MQLRLTLAVAAAALLMAGTAQADETSGSLGSVTATVGPTNSVLVLRGNTTYRLQEGDTLFEGDLVFTRTNGSTTLNLNGCTVELPKASSLPIGSESCNLAPTQLASTEVIGGFEIAAGAGGVGGTPALLGLALLAGGGAAAAGGGGGGGNAPVQPVSP